MGAAATVLLLAGRSWEDGVIPDDSEVGDNLTGIIAVYREWVVGQ